MMNTHGVPFREIRGHRVVLFEDMSDTIKEDFSEYLKSSGNSTYLSMEGVPHALYVGWQDGDDS